MMNLSIEKTIVKYADKLGQNDFEFLKRLYQTNPEIYTNRLKMIGFENQNHVLDVGCGFGQWSICLSKLNSTVTSTDISSSRVIIAYNIATSMGKKNIQFKQSDLISLPLEKIVLMLFFLMGLFF